MNKWELDGPGCVGGPTTQWMKWLGGLVEGIKSATFDFGCFCWGIILRRGRW
jgi:hypothetical protein